MRKQTHTCTFKLTGYLSFLPHVHPLFLLYSLSIWAYLLCRTCDHCLLEGNEIAYAPGSLCILVMLALHSEHDVCARARCAKCIKRYRPIHKSISYHVPHTEIPLQHILLSGVNFSTCASLHEAMPTFVKWQERP